jgi:hypothetical protein
MMMGLWRTVQEPTKAELVAYEANHDDVPPRAAFVILQAFPKAPLVEATVLLSGAKPSVTAWKEVRATTRLQQPSLALPASVPQSIASA